MYENKTRQTDAAVSKFIETITDEKKQADSRRIIELMAEATGEEPKMWGTSIVGFGKYHYKYESGHEGDSMLSGFSPRKANFTLYLMLGYLEFYYKDYDKLMAGLGKYKLGKGCLYINKLEDVDAEKLKELVKVSFEFLRDKYSGK